MATKQDRMYILERVNGNHQGYGRPSDETLECRALGFVVLVRDAATDLWHGLLTKKGHDWLINNDSKRDPLTGLCNPNGFWTPGDTLRGVLWA